MSELVLKEFLYVDVDRTRSLLAQLQGGIVDAMTSESANTLGGGASASLFGFGARGEYGHEARHQESRSFQEMVFVAFEKLADDAGLISTLGDEVRNPEAWRSGEVHSGLREGLIVRLECDVQILDGQLFGERLSRFDKMVDGVLRLNPEVTPKHSTPKDRQRLSAMAKASFMGGLKPDQLQAISEFVDAFVGESISLRALPCGAENLELGFGGALLGRREYIQEERESLFSRYGTVASNWTCVMQIAAIPKTTNAEPGDEAGSPKEDATPREEEEAEEASEILTQDGEAINRAAMEGVAVELLSMMEGVGVVEGPRWPTISVTPLAIYRTVPRNA